MGIPNLSVTQLGPLVCTWSRNGAPWTQFEKMILGEDPKHVFQLDTNLSLSLRLCLSPRLRLSLSLVLDLASILVSAFVLVLVLVLALGLARRPEAESGSHLDANIGNTSFSL